MSQPAEIHRLLARERSADLSDRSAGPGRGAWRFLLAYPAPYAVGMSSLGLLTLHREINARSGWSAERVFPPAEGGRSPAGPADGPRLAAWESGDAAHRFAAIGISVAHELEIARAADLLEGLGLPPRRSQRTKDLPLVVIGGPLTFINPRPLAPLADLVVVGEADRAIHALCAALEAADAADRATLANALPPALGFWWPGRSADPPAPVQAALDDLPAHSARWSPDAELADMALVEVSRGCARSCAFCASGRHGGTPHRVVPAGRILAAIPTGAPRVGLVGTAVSDHPEIKPLVSALVGRGLGVGLSSVRVGRLDAELLDLLTRGGLRSLALGVDGASERLRREMHKGVTEAEIRRAAALAAHAGLRRLKLYQLVGLPGETNDDLDELVALTLDLSHIVPVAVTLSPFVPKPGTPLATAPQLPIREVERRLRRVARGLKGRVRLRSGSARWAWVEAQIAAGDQATGEAILAARDQGGAYPAYRRALSQTRDRDPA